MMREQATPAHERPLAAPGLISYRYPGRYGWIMIGAADDVDALSEARRSATAPVMRELLEIWDSHAGHYISAVRS